MKYFTHWEFIGDTSWKVTVSVRDILRSSSAKMWRTKFPEMTNCRVIEDWIAVHWAVETDKYGTPIS